MPEPISAAKDPPDAVQHGRALLAFLARHREKLSPLLILTHDFPDPDALASAYALQHLAQSAYGISSRIACEGEIGRTENKTMVRLLRIPVRRFRGAWLKQFSAVALVDTQPVFENNPFPRNRRATIVVDQHGSVTPPEGDFVVIDPDCGATCVIFAQALLAAGGEIPARVATALAYGILTDTLDLSRAHRADVVQTYLEVLSHADMRTLARIQNPTRSRRFFATLGKGITGARLFRQFLVSHLGDVETPDLVSQVAEFLLAYERIRWCLVTGRYRGRLHASLRAANVDAQAGEVLRSAFNNPRDAGGHGPIAGGSCRISRVGIDTPEETWREREDQVAARVQKRLRIAATTAPRKPFER